MNHKQPAKWLSTEKISERSFKGDFDPEVQQWRRHPRLSGEKTRSRGQPLHNDDFVSYIVAQMGR